MGRVPDRQSAEEIAFEAFLRARNLKVTTERMGILRAIVQRRDHVDADTLQAELRDHGISRATIYRTLDLLVQCGLVRRQNLGTNHAVFEAAFGTEHHDHLVCVDCGKVIEFFREDLEKLQETICVEHHFRPLQHTLQIFGLCEGCEGRFDPNRLPKQLSQIHG